MNLNLIKEVEVEEEEEGKLRTEHIVDNFVRKECSAEMGVGVNLRDITLVKNAGEFFEISEWLTTKEAAIYLRKFSREGVPSANAVHKLVARGSIRRRKFAGRLFFRKKELDFLIESSVI